MKMITRRGIFLWILSVLFLCGLIFMTASLIEDGDEWVMKFYNSHVYSDGKLIAAGSVRDRDGVNPSLWAIMWFRVYMELKAVEAEMI